MNEPLKITALYVGSSMLGPLRAAEREIRRAHKLDLSVATHNFGATMTDSEWRDVARDISESEIIFVFHVTDGENATSLLRLLSEYEARHRAVVVINCMPELMRRTRMGALRFGSESSGASKDERRATEGRARKLLHGIGGWMGEQMRGQRARKNRPRHTQYLKLIERLPTLLRLVPNAGRLRDVKNYLYLFCYFLQPTPNNVRAMLLYAIKHYAGGERSARIDFDVPPPEAMPSVAVFHPDAPALFETFDAYRAWYERRARDNRDLPALRPEQTIGLLLMRPQIVSGTHRHYDGLIRAIEAEGLAVIPAISTFMDNREACAQFFVDKSNKVGKEGKRARGVHLDESDTDGASRVSQIISLTGFSFVGGPAMNDSEAAVEFLSGLNRPFRSAVSLDVQTIEAWRESATGLNPVQAGMQIAIPEIDGATEPFVFGGMSAHDSVPIPLEDRCRRIARRLSRWNRLRTTARAEVKLALLVFCFPPNKGNLGTAADLDVFPSLHETLLRLQSEGYRVEVPADADQLRQLLLGGNSESYGAAANVTYRMSADEYRRLCPHAAEIETEWGAAPGSINSFGRDLLIQGITLGNIFIGVQPTFGYEGDPMRLLMAHSGAPHHGFAALYVYLDKIFGADAVVHVGTHGALEFMPGKQVGLSNECWPDRLIGELPHVYIYSVNNPSEGSIARRRSYAELISYLTPPVEDAGVYRDLASLKELLAAYRQATDERERERLFALVEEKAATLHFEQRPTVMQV
ncbi:MAG: cobaltochelatase subunit CobN [Acidobacteriota bacterium]|nr:cobaltochelatase subunit CobN [Acidobacteriota bacterium]